MAVQAGKPRGARRAGNPAAALLAAVLFACATAPVAEGALQAPPAVLPLAAPLPNTLRFTREIGLPAGADSGPACAALDAAAMAHAASPAHNDLRLFAAPASAPAQAVETPFVFAESGPAAVETAVLQPLHVQASGSRLSFDLAMPSRPFADLNLALSARGFIGTARVWSMAQPGGARQGLGVFPVYDLDGLGHGLTLAMAESTAPLVHVELALRDPSGRPLSGVRPTMLGAVTVPPSRERQTLFDAVARTASLETVPSAAGTRTLAVVQVPAHLPIERVAVGLDPGFAANFRRPLTVLAWPRHPQPPSFTPTPAAGPVFLAVGRHDPAPPTPTEVEFVAAGDLSRVRMPSGDPGLQPLHAEQLTAPAVLGANLRDAATVEIAVDNGPDHPLPIRFVSLLMRRRSVCFRASPGMRYTLRYGDPDLPPPATDPGLRLDGSVLTANLGPEAANPGFRDLPARKPYLAAHPDTLWAVVLALTAGLAGTALHRVKRAGGIG